MVRDITQPTDVFSAIVFAHRGVREHKGRWAQSDVNILVIILLRVSVYLDTGLGESATICLTQTIFYILSTANQLLVTDLFLFYAPSGKPVQWGIGCPFH